MSHVIKGRCSFNLTHTFTLQVGTPPPTASGNPADIECIDLEWIGHGITWLLCWGACIPLWLWKDKFSGEFKFRKKSSELFMEHLGKSNLKVIQVMPQVHNILKVLQQFGQLIYCWPFSFQSTYMAWNYIHSSGVLMLIINVGRVFCFYLRICTIKHWMCWFRLWTVDIFFILMHNVSDDARMDT